MRMPDLPVLFSMLVAAFGPQPTSWPATLTQGPTSEPTSAPTRIPTDVPYRKAQRFRRSSNRVRLPAQSWHVEDKSGHPIIPGELLAMHGCQHSTGPAPVTVPEPTSPSTGSSLRSTVRGVGEALIHQDGCQNQLLERQGNGEHTAFPPLATNRYRSPVGLCNRLCYG